MVWGGGLLAKMGVLDFGGGIVVHNLAGMAALAAVLFVGRRKIADSTPSNLPLMSIGMGLLWFGWFGFNSGNELAVDGITALACVNTQMSGALAGVAWLAMSWMIEGKPKFLGFLTGALAGLVVITPCAGYVTPTSSVIIGLLAGVVCYGAVMLKNRMKWDDALDVWGVHGVGGFLGILLLGVLADKSVNPAGADGLLHGNPALLGTQALASVISSVVAFGVSWFILRGIQTVTRVRTTEAEEAKLDVSIHGEFAYEPTESDFEAEEEGVAA
jgi:ammonium transporter, Amt family